MYEGAKADLLFIVTVIILIIITSLTCSKYNKFTVSWQTFLKNSNEVVTDVFTCSAPYLIEI